MMTEHLTEVASSRTIASVDSRYKVQQEENGCGSRAACVSLARCTRGLKLSTRHMDFNIASREVIVANPRSIAVEASDEGD